MSHAQFMYKEKGKQRIFSQCNYFESNNWQESCSDVLLLSVVEIDIVSVVIHCSQFYNMVIKSCTQCCMPKCFAKSWGRMMSWVSFPQAGIGQDPQ